MAIKLLTLILNQKVEIGPKKLEYLILTKKFNQNIIILNLKIWNLIFQFWKLTLR